MVQPSGNASVNVSSMLDLDAVEVVVTFTGPINVALEIVTKILLADCAMTHQINHELEERGGVLHVAITDLGCDRFMIYLFLAHLR